MSDRKLLIEHFYKIFVQTSAILGSHCVFSTFPIIRGWSGGAMVLGKLSLPGRPTNLD